MTIHEREATIIAALRQWGHLRLGYIESPPGDEGSWVFEDKSGCLFGFETFEQAIQVVADHLRGEARLTPAATAKEV